MASSDKKKSEAQPISPRDHEERARMAIIAWCLKKNGGPLKIPAQELLDIMNGEGHIELQPDLDNNQIIVSLPYIEDGTGKSTKYHLDHKMDPSHQRASALEIE